MAKVHKVIIQGQGSIIHGKYWCNEDSTAPVALIMPSHPINNIGMDNIVIYNLFHVFKESGLSVLRIEFSNDNQRLPLESYTTAQMTLDAYSAMQWLTERHKDASHYWITSFSLSAEVLFNIISRRPEVENFVAISPVYKLNLPQKTTATTKKKAKSQAKSNAIRVSDFSSSTMPSGLYVYGSQDKFVSKEEHEQIALACQEKNPEIKYHCVKGAGHTLANSIESIKELCDVVKEHIQISLATRISIPIRKKRRKRKKRDEVVL